MMDIKTKNEKRTKPADWMNEARALAAQCWCDEETKGIEMDAVLAEAFAKRLAAWMDTAASYAVSVEYYRGLLVQCGELLGPEAYRADDGSVMENVLVAKIPEILKTLRELPPQKPADAP